MATSRCPLCDAAIENPELLSSRPFCSPRCKKLDLMNWLEGRYTLPRELSEEDILSLSPEDQQALLGAQLKRLS